MQTLYAGNSSVSKAIDQWLSSTTSLNIAAAWPLTRPTSFTSRICYRRFSDFSLKVDKHDKIRDAAA